MSDDIKNNVSEESLSPFENFVSSMNKINDELKTKIEEIKERRRNKNKR